jgi:hypothetical protein
VLWIWFVKVCCAFCSRVLFADQCDDVGVLANYAIVGANSFTTGNNSEINDNTITGSGNTPTPTGNMTTITPAFPSLPPFPTTGFVNSSSANPLPPGRYGTVSYGNNVTVTLRPGDYYIARFSIGNNSNMVINPPGKVTLHIKNSFQGGNQLHVNSGGDTGNFRLNLYTNATLQIGNANQGDSELDFNGIIYSPYSSTIQFGNNNQIQGAILSAGVVQVGNNTQFGYSGAVQSSVVEAFGCDPAEVYNRLSVEADFTGFTSTTWPSTTPLPVDITFSTTNSNLGAGWRYNGTVTLELIPADGSALGSYSLISGAGSLNDSVPNDGIASYTFANSDSIACSGSGNYNCSRVRLALSTAYCGQSFRLRVTDSDGVTDETDPITLVCGSALTQLRLTPASTNASTCHPLAITVRAEDSEGDLVSDYSGTVTLTTSTAHGNWSVTPASGSNPNPPVNSLSPTPDNDDNGSVGYSFSAADGGVITLYLSNSHADSGVVITVNDSGNGLSATSGAVTFRDNVLVITPTSTTAGIANSAKIIAGRPHQFSVALWTRDGSNCQQQSGYNLASQGLRGYIDRDGVLTSAANPQLVNSANQSVTLTSSVPMSDNLTLNFSSGGVASFTLNTSDVGRYSLILADHSGSFAHGYTVAGDLLLTVVPAFVNKDVRFFMQLNFRQPPVLPMTLAG